MLTWAQHDLQQAVKINFAPNAVFLTAGQKINRIAVLGQELVRLREQRKRLKTKTWTIPTKILDVFQDLAELGATVDVEGWIITENEI